MMIQCDVCEKDGASLFCVADEAALCSACDHRVHHANKLAGKHQRFSLNQPSPKHAPLCDICQERRAFLFCQQDRAVLCSVCDIPIHKANKHTQNHTRFLLTGIQLSATSSLYSASPSLAESFSSCLNDDKTSDNVSNNNIKKPEDSKGTKPVCLIAPTCTPSTARGTTTVQTEKSNYYLNGMVSASSISEYLEKLPGWHVEDFLDSSSSPSPCYGFSKNGENEVLPFWDVADFQSNVSAFHSEKMGSSMEMAFGFANGFNEHSMEFTTYNNNNIKTIRKESEDNSFAVPQISPHSI